MGSQQTSSTSAATFILDVRNDYNDTTTRHFTQNEMLEYLNNGQLDIGVKSHCIEATEPVTLAVGTLEYAITTEYIEVKAVHFIDSDGKKYALEKGAPHRVGLDIKESDTDYPTFWYEFDGKIGAYPVLTSRTTETLTAYLIQRPVDIAIGANLTIPATYENALKSYMLARMALKDKNDSLFAQMMNQYNSEMGAYRKDLNEQATK